MWMFLLIFNTVLAAWQDTPSWQHVYDLFHTNQLAEALQSMQSVDEKENPSYFYNVGTLLLEKGEKDAATAYLKKALLMIPNDAMFQNNFALARTGSSFEELPATDSLLALFSSNWVLVFAALGFLTFNRPTLRLLHAGSCLLILGVFFARPDVSLLTQESALRSGPGDEYMELGRLKAASRVTSNRLSDTTADWIQLASHTGWVKKAALLRLFP